MDLGLRGRVALVTGASSGIGAEIAVALGGEGARVALTYRSGADRAAAVVERVEAAGGEALPVPMDLTDHASIDAAVKAVRDHWGGIDTLVANAIVYGERPRAGLVFEDIDPATWRQELRDNLEGTLATVRAALGAMRGRRDGRIVLISSNIAEEGFAGSWAYGTAKAGLLGFARSLAWDLGPEGIFVNVISVGFTLTDANREWGPMVERATRTTITRRLSTPDDVANLVTYFASPANRSVTGELIREGSSTTRSHHGAFLEA